MRKHKPGAFARHITYPMPSTEAVSHSLGLSDRKMAHIPVTFYLEARAALALQNIKAALATLREKDPQ